MTPHPAGHRSFISLPAMHALVRSSAWVESTRRGGPKPQAVPGPSHQSWATKASRSLPRPPLQVFVLVADPQGQILDSKEYLAPIITPHEAMLAWGAAGEGEWDEQRYSLGFEEAAAAGEAAGAGGMAPPLQRPRRQQPRFSLLAGGYTGDGGSSESDDGEDAAQAEADASTALALHAQQALVVSAAPQGRSDLVQPRSAADYLLHKRSWQGVEAPLVGAAPKAVEAAVEGRSGRAAGYADEPGKQPAAEPRQ